MAQRRDARLNRARLVAAAEAVFAAHGNGASLDLVAEQAGVGRATLYRHFPDRPALVAAVLDSRVDALERRVAGMTPAEALHVVVHTIGARLASSPGLLTSVRRSPEGRAQLDAVTERVRGLLSRTLDDARQVGTVHADVTVEDLVLVLSMVDGVVAHTPPPHVTAAVERAAELALRGVLVPVPAGR